MSKSKNLLQQIVVGLIFDPTKRMFAMIERKGNSNMVEFPGGKQESGESDIDALKREIKEETGVTFTKYIWLESFISESKEIKAALCLFDTQVSDSETAVYWVKHPNELLDRGYCFQECVMYFYNQVIKNISFIT